MFVVVTTDGRYHGDTQSEETARLLPIVKESKTPGFVRLLPANDWDKVKNGSTGDRSKAASEIGKAL